MTDVNTKRLSLSACIVSDTFSVSESVSMSLCISVSMSLCIYVCMSVYCQVRPADSLSDIVSKEKTPIISVYLCLCVSVYLCLYVCLLSGETG